MAHSATTSTLAHDIIENLGGAENIRSLTHCATRLRVDLRDNDRADRAALAALPPVMAAVAAGGQMQIVIGTDVESVYHDVQAALGGTREEAAAPTRSDAPEAAISRSVSAEAPASARSRSASR